MNTMIRINESELKQIIRHTLKETLTKALCEKNVTRR